MSTADQDNVETKTFEGYLIVDWKRGEMRHRKTKPNDISPTELAIPVSIDVRVPEVQIPTIEAAIDVPAAQVEQSVVDETREMARETGLVDDDE